MNKEEVNKSSASLASDQKVLQDFKILMGKLNEKLVHDLRSPLTVITLQAELMKMEETISSHAKEICSRIIESGKKIDAILAEYIAKSSSF